MSKHTPGPWKYRGTLRTYIVEPVSSSPHVIYNLPTCDVCGDGFTPEEWNDRHDGHEPDCPVRLCEGYDGGCDCDLVYHDRCCPDCVGED